MDGSEIFFGSLSQFERSIMLWNGGWKLKLKISIHCVSCDVLTSIHCASCDVLTSIHCASCDILQAMKHRAIRMGWFHLDLRALCIHTLLIYTLSIPFVLLFFFFLLMKDMPTRHGGASFISHHDDPPPAHSLPLLKRR